MVDYKKQANDLISKFRADMKAINQKYADPGVKIPGEYTVSPADSNEDTLRQQQEARSLEMEKTHMIDPTTGKWIPIQKPYSRQGFRSAANENYWLNQAKSAGLSVNSIDDVIALQKSLGVTADDKWGNASMAAYKAKNQSRQQPQQQTGIPYRLEPEKLELYDWSNQKGVNEFAPGKQVSNPVNKPQQKSNPVYRRNNPTADKPYNHESRPTDNWADKMAWGLSDWIGNTFHKINSVPTMKYQQGGAIQSQQAPAQDEQQAFVQYIAQIFGVKTQQDLKKVVQQLGKEGMQQLQAAFKQGISPEQIRNQMGNNNQAQFARNGAKICPDGTRLVFKAGGCMCQKMQDGGSTKKRFTSKPPIKKKDINPNDTIHVNGRPHDISGGKTKYPPLTKDKYRRLPTSKKVDVDLKDQASGRSVPQRRFGGVIQRFGQGGQMGGEFQDGIGMRSFADQIVGRPKMKCGGRTKKRLVPKKK